MDSGAKQDIEKSGIYEQAGRLSEENTEESLEKAMLLYRSIRGWQDADAQYIACRTRLGRMRWLVESAVLKEEEKRFTAIRLSRYNRAAEYFTAGEFERSAAAFQEMGNFKNSRGRVYLSAVELYKAGRYEEALPYFVWLDGDYDNGYYLRKCRERLADQDVGISETENRK